VGGQGQEAPGEVVAAGRVPPDDQEGVVAGDGAEHLGQLGLVEAGGEVLGGAGRGAQHDQVGAGLGRHEQLAAQLGQAGLAGGGLGGRHRSPVAALGRYGVHQGAGGGPDLHRVELEQVARQGGLGHADTAVRQHRRELALGVHLVVGDQLDDLLVPGVLCRRAQR
jgi:hypothetical protein